MSSDILNVALDNLFNKFETEPERPYVFSNICASLQKNIEEWKVERRTLFLEEQEMLKATKTFFDQSNLLLNFCKDCHKAFLEGNAEQKRKIIKIVCSNFSYDGETLDIVPNPVFKVIIKNNLSNKNSPSGTKLETGVGVNDIGINNLYEKIIDINNLKTFRLLEFFQRVA